MRHERLDSMIVALLLILSATVVIGAIYKKETMRASPPDIETGISTDTVSMDTSFMGHTPEEGLWDALAYYDIHHPEIVYAQAIQESGLGKSPLYKRTNNLFGLYDSRKGKYYSFSHWSESVLAYKNLIQYRYRPTEDYYRFLDRIGYASDYRYTATLKRIVEDEQRKCDGGDTVPSK